VTVRIAVTHVEESIRECGVGAQHRRQNVGASSCDRRSATAARRCAHPAHRRSLRCRRDETGSDDRRRQRDRRIRCRPTFPTLSSVPSRATRHSAEARRRGRCAADQEIAANRDRKWTVRMPSRRRPPTAGTFRQSPYHGELKDKELLMRTLGAMYFQCPCRSETGPAAFLLARRERPCEYAAHASTRGPACLRHGVDRDRAAGRGSAASAPASPKLACFPGERRRSACRAAPERSAHHERGRRSERDAKLATDSKYQKTVSTEQRLMGRMTHK
jgi:hypothetical protein